LFSPFWEGVLTGFAIQDAIFIMAAAVVGPAATLWWLSKRPKILVPVLKAARKDPAVAREIALIFTLGEAAQDDVIESWGRPR
jgi:hypothetical protein